MNKLEQMMKELGKEYLELACPRCGSDEIIYYQNCLISNTNLLTDSKTIYCDDWEDSIETEAYHSIVCPDCGAVWKTARRFLNAFMKKYKGGDINDGRQERT